MPLVPYDPWNLWRREIGHFPSLHHILEDDWFDSQVAAAPRPVRVDVRESATHVVVTAEIPGLERKEDVSISVHDRHLHLQGKIERTDEHKNDNFHRTERYYGQFTRTIPLPAAVDESNARATYRNGILEVSLPKATSPERRQIDVDFH